MIGEYVMTQYDRFNDTTKVDTIGMGSYGVDSHHAQRIVLNNYAWDEGKLSNCNFKRILK